MEALQVPAAVQTILAARIDRLPPVEKRLLQAASVIGKDVLYAVLTTIAEQTEEVLRRGLAHLQEAEFLHETQLFPDLEYTFKHALTHEVAYESLLHERRRALHERILEAIERLYPEHLGEQVERLAHHAFRGELWPQAVAYLSQAGEKALRSSANVAARGFFEQALAAFERLPESLRTPEGAIDLRLSLRPALLRLGDFDRMREHSREARVLAEAAGDEGRLGWVLVHMGESFRADGEHRQGIEAAERALAIATTRDDALLELHARFHLGSSHNALGNFERAIETLEPNGRPPAIELFLGAAGGPVPVPASMAARALAQAQTGDFAAAVPLAEQAARIAEQVGWPLHQVTGWNWLGSIHLLRGDVERSRPLLERAVETARTYEIWFLFDPVLVGLACATATAGRAADALALLSDVGTRGPARLWIQPAGTEAWRAETYLLAGQLEDARESANRALAIARSRGERPHEARARLLVGHVYAGGAQAAEAELHYRAALSIADELGMRPLVAHCHLGLAKLYQRTDRREQAREHRATATTMYREMGMTYWLAKAEAELNARQPS